MAATGTLGQPYTAADGDTRDKEQPKMAATGTLRAAKNGCGRGTEIGSHFLAAYFDWAVRVPSAVWMVRVEPGGTEAADLMAWPSRRVMEKPRLRMLSG